MTASQFPMPLYVVLLIATAATLTWMINERRTHNRNLRSIPTRIVVNGIRGKSSVTRLIAGALRTQQTWNTVAKTTGTAARFIYPGGREVAIKRPNNIVNVIEQVAIVRKAADLDSQALVIECMAVMPELQEFNQEVLVQGTIVVITNVRADHLEEMGPTLDDVARSLARSMPVGGTCVTAERERFDVLAVEARKRGCELIYADPEQVTDTELNSFGYITFKDNVACALEVAKLVGITRDAAMAGMMSAAPDPGVLKVEEWTYNDHMFRVANLFAANDPESTMMNLRLLQRRRSIGRSVSLVINCRPDRVDRNRQMAELVDQIDPKHIVLIGTPTKSAHERIPAAYLDRVIDLQRVGDGLDTLERMVQHLPPAGHDLVLVGNIHGGGEELLAALAEHAERPARRLAHELFDREATTILNAPQETVK